MAQEAENFKNQSQDAEKMQKKAPRGHKSAPRRPQEAQDGPKMAPRGPKTAPRWLQDGPKTAPRRLQVASKSHLAANLLPRCLQVAILLAMVGTSCLQDAYLAPRGPPRGPQEAPKRPFFVPHLLDSRREVLCVANEPAKPYYSDSGTKANSSRCQKHWGPLVP